MSSLNFFEISSKTSLFADFFKASVSSRTANSVFSSASTRARNFSSVSVQTRSFLGFLTESSAMLSLLLGSFSKSRRRRQRERQQTKGLMSRTMVLHVRFDSLYISLPSSAKQQREMTKFYVFWSTRTAMANFCVFLWN